MRLPRGCWTALRSATILILMCTAWAALAPIQFGGQTSYVIVAGASMEPTLFRGDLVLVRERNHYDVGEVVTYLDPRVGPIIHRIVKEQDGHYVLKGDNNDWLDPHKPQNSEIIGSYWLHFPNLGKIIGQANEPALMAIAAFLLVLMIMKTGSKKTKKPKTGFNRFLRRWSSWLASLGTESIEGLFFLLGAVALAGLILALAAFSKPATREAFVDTPYEYRGSFRYSGEAPAGIYDNGSFRTGDPIFFNLSDSIDVSFNFELASDALEEANGSAQLLIQLSNDYGWRRTFELIPETEFSGNAVEIRSTIDLQPIRSIIDELHERTEVKLATYDLLVLPIIHVDAKVGEHHLDGAFSPQMRFELKDKVMQLVPEAELVTSTPTLVATQAGMLRKQVTEHETMSILTLSMKVRTARQIAVAALCISLPGMIVLGVGLMHAVQHGKETEIKLRYGSILLDVSEPVKQRGDKVAQVTNIDDLARFAEKQGQMILVYEEDGGRGYYVREGKTLYRYWHPMGENGIHEDEAGED